MAQVLTKYLQVRRSFLLIEMEVESLHVAQLEAKEFKVLARPFRVKHEHQNKCTPSTFIAKETQKTLEPFLCHFILTQNQSGVS